MKVTLFRKVRHTKEGKAFNAFVSKLSKKDGSEIYCTVKFSGDIKDAFNPDACPYIIDVNKSDANMSKRTLVNEDTGEKTESYTLWVKKYSVSDEKYVDHSLDDFE